MNDITSGTISIDEAIKKAKTTISYPTLAIFFAIAGLSIYLGANQIVPVWFVVVGIIVALIAAWIFWTKKIIKWTDWAFTNVDDVAGLKARAVKERLIDKDYKFIEDDDDDFLDEAEKQKLQVLQAKFDQAPEFVDDLSVPDETNIYFSRNKIFVNMLIALGTLGLGVFLLYVGDKIIYRIFGGALIAFGAYTLYIKYKELNNPEPQVTINNKGIQVAGEDFYTWSEITNEEVAIENTKSTIEDCYLAFDCPNDKSVRQDLEDYAIEVKNLKNLLVVYRGRYTNSQTRTRNNG